MLAYHPHNNIGAAGQYDLQHVAWTDLTFENVSRDFITEFFYVGNPLAGHVEYLYFISCTIPPISGPFICSNVHLIGVPATNAAAFSNNDDSLYNLLLSWDRDGCLDLTACSTFNDKFIHWLADDRGDGECEVYGLKC